MRAFALTVPGLGPVLADELRRAGIEPGPVEHDGRADVVPIADATEAQLRRLRVADVVLAEVARTRLDRLRSIDVRAERVVVRLRAEHGITRTALRDALTGRGRREVWVLQSTAHHVRIGVPLTRAPSADRRPGALQPVVAAAMVSVLGSVTTLLDPCAGAGSIVRAARHTGTVAIGGDIEPLADVRVDARRLPFADDTFDAVASNLPFGGTYRVHGSPVAWYRRVLQESMRVAPRAVVLAPPSTPFRQALGRVHVDLVTRHDIVLLGRRATMWSLRRAGGTAR